jgi:hypothetical protein
MENNYWQETIMEPLKTVLQHAWNFIVNNLLTMIVILILGLVIAWIIKQILSILLKVFRFDRFCDRHGFTAGMQKIGISRTPSEALSRFFFWLLFLIFLMFSLNVLNIAPLADLTSKFFTFIPNLLIAIVIIFVGYFLSGFLHRAVLLGAVNANIKHAKLLAGGVHVIAMFFFIAIALEQMGIGEHIVMATFITVLICIGLAAAIAFGLGAKDVVKDFLEKQMKEPKEEDKDEISHL